WPLTVAQALLRNTHRAAQPALGGLGSHCHTYSFGKSLLHGFQAMRPLIPWRDPLRASSRCPLWVISGHWRVSTSCPLCAKSRHAALDPFSASPDFPAV